MNKFWRAVYALNIEVFHVAVYDPETDKLVTRVYRDLDMGTPGE
jgi:hypothetical protein